MCQIYVICYEMHVAMTREQTAQLLPYYTEVTERSPMDDGGMVLLAYCILHQFPLLNIHQPQALVDWKAITANIGVNRMSRQLQTMQGNVTATGWF
jgi:hypothetical protein